MNTRDRRNGRRRRQILVSPDFDTANPMDSLSNFSDVMLVLAVGIMLALVLHWKVPLNQTSPENRNTGSETVSGPVFLEDSDLTRVGDIPEGAQQIGNVYYDTQTGRYYIVEE